MLNKLKKVTANALNVSESSVMEDSSIIADLGADDIDRITLLMDLEEAFDVEITDDEARELETVGVFSAS